MTKKRKATKRKAQRDDGPTPERLAKEAIKPERGADGVTRLMGAPLSRLFTRRLLSKDAGENLAMFNAGERVYAAYVEGGLTGIKAFDFDSAGGAGGAKGIPFSARQAMARDDLKRLTGGLDRDQLKAVMGVVIHEFPVEYIGRQLTGYKDEKQARAVGLYTLQTGLKRVLACQ